MWKGKLRAIHYEEERITSEMMEEADGIEWMQQVCYFFQFYFETVSVNKVQMERNIA